MGQSSREGRQLPPGLIALKDTVRWNARVSRYYGNTARGLNWPFRRSFIGAPAVREKPFAPVYRASRRHGGDASFHNSFGQFKEEVAAPKLLVCNVYKRGDVTFSRLHIAHISIPLKATSTNATSASDCNPTYISSAHEGVCVSLLLFKEGKKNKTIQQSEPCSWIQARSHRLACYDSV